MMEEVIKFRNALENLNMEYTPTAFQYFPFGACGDASDILAEHLKSLGASGIEYVCGISDELGSHAWLEIDGEIIDITSDQFEGIDIKVYIGRPNEWYRKFHEHDRREAGYLHMHGPAIGALLKVHSRVKEIINA